jgi:hypothetical protein
MTSDDRKLKTLTQELEVTTKLLGVVTKERNYERQLNKELSRQNGLMQEWLESLGDEVVMCSWENFCTHHPEARGWNK